MRQFQILTLAFILCLCFYGCKNNKDKDSESDAQTPVSVSTTTKEVPLGDTSENSLDWNGQYKGTLPCADCEGINTTLTLKASGDFRRSLEYIGKSENTIEETGIFSWDASGSNITLSLEDGSTQSYKVGENRLWQLDQNGERIAGELADKYLLYKNKMDYALENKTWVLTELMGQTVESSENRKEATLRFLSEEALIAGNNSCNQIGGSYELLDGNRIKIGTLRSTMMACPDMSIADELNQVLEKIDNYTVLDGVLQLNKARMAPLAKFKLKDE